MLLTEFSRRTGRNFEYISEDPWLSTVLVAKSITGDDTKRTTAHMA